MVAPNPGASTPLRQPLLTWTVGKTIIAVHYCILYNSFQAAHFLFILAIHPQRYNGFLIFLVLLSGAQLEPSNMFIQILETPKAWWNYSVEKFIMFLNFLVLPQQLELYNWDCSGQVVSGSMYFFLAWLRRRNQLFIWLDHKNKFPF